MHTLALIIFILYVLSFFLGIALAGLDKIDWRKVITHFVGGFSLAVLIYG